MALPYDIPGSAATTPGEFNNPSPTTNSGATNILGYPQGSSTGTNPASTSNVTGWIPDILTIIQEAAEHAGVDATTGYLLRSAKRSLDFLSMSWSNYGLNLWLLDELQTPLSVGVAQYAMPPDTIDLISPAISTTQNGQTLDILIAREDFETYLSQPNKQFQGKPVVIFVHRTQPSPSFFVWPVPNSYQPYTLKWWRLRRPQNTGYATNSLDIPFEFIPSITFGLAWQLALKKTKKDFNLIQVLKNNYDQEFRQARNENRDRSPVYISPYVPFD